LIISSQKCYFSN